MFVNPLIPFWLITPIVTVLIIFLVWQESKKPYRFRILRIIAVILMMFALTGLLFKPSYQTKKSSNIILLTPRLFGEKVDSILLASSRLDAHASGTNSSLQEFNTSFS